MIKVRNRETGEFESVGRERTTIPSAELGVTLIISEEALEEIRRIEHEHVLAAIECEDMLWD